MLRVLLIFVVSLVSLQLPASGYYSIDGPTHDRTKKQFIYVLKLQPAYRKQNNWTKTTDEIVSRHFAYLKKLTDEGTVILAGRTTYDVADKNVFGIVILETGNEAAARIIMEQDPAIMDKVMKAELHPFSVAFLRK
jgi:uncharacterized protein YciI